MRRWRWRADDGDGAPARALARCVDGDGEQMIYKSYIILLYILYIIYIYMTTTPTMMIMMMMMMMHVLFSVVCGICVEGGFGSLRDWGRQRTEAWDLMWFWKICGWEAEGWEACDLRMGGRLVGRCWLVDCWV